MISSPKYLSYLRLYEKTFQDKVKHVMMERNSSSFFLGNFKVIGVWKHWCKWNSMYSFTSMVVLHTKVLGYLFRKMHGLKDINARTSFASFPV